MSEPTLLQISRVPLDQIEVRERLRPVSDAAVDSLIASISEIGVMKDAIHLRKKKDGRFHLIAGAHRLEAAKRLGWADIEAKVWTNVTDDWSRIMEVDDNLAGAELTPLDTAMFLAVRKEVYERLHPETKRGVAGARRRWDATDTMSVAFVKTTAEKFSLSERHVFRLLAAGTKLAPDEANKLRRAPKPVRLEDLLQIAKTTEAPERYHVVDALAAGTAKSAAEARRSWAQDGRPTLPQKADATEVDIGRLESAWTRASVTAQRRFVRLHATMIAEFLRGAADE